MQSFISDSKTPPMHVVVTDANQKFIRSYDVPAGFQLDQYVLSISPENSIITCTVSPQFKVELLNNSKEIHIGYFYRNL